MSYLSDLSPFVLHDADLLFVLIPPGLYVPKDQRVLASKIVTWSPTFLRSLQYYGFSCSLFLSALHLFLEIGETLLDSGFGLADGSQELQALQLAVLPNLIQASLMYGSRLMHAWTNLTKLGQACYKLV